MAARPPRTSRFLAATVAASLGTFSPTVLAATTTTAMVQDSEVTRLFAEGQERYSNDDFAGAADSWSRLLDLLPEAQANKATRENVLLNITQAYLDAYNRSRKNDGSKDIEHLRSGKKVLEEYFAGYRKAYGDRAGVSQAVQEKSDELEEELRKAEEELAAASATPDPGAGTKPPDGGTTEPKQPPDGGGQQVIVLKPQNTGNGLIVGGAVVGFLGLGALTMGVIGAVRAPKAEDDYTQAVADGDTLAQEEADFRGKQANQLTIAGFVLAPLLLGGGAAMIYFGVKQKKNAQHQEPAVTVTPLMGPRFSGLGLSGRF